MAPELWSLLGDFGPMGVFVAYLVWRESKDQTQRLQHERDRVEADKALASALGALTATIQRLDR